MGLYKVAFSGIDFVLAVFSVFWKISMPTIFFSSYGWKMFNFIAYSFDIKVAY
jgi:hypothetical protein